MIQGVLVDFICERCFTCCVKCCLWIFVDRELKRKESFMSELLELQKLVETSFGTREYPAHGSCLAFSCNGTAPR